MSKPRQYGFVDSEFDSRKGTRRGQFLAKMEQAVPWQRLLSLIEPHYQDPASGRRRLDLEMMLRIHLILNPAVDPKQTKRKAMQHGVFN